MQHIILLPWRIIQGFIDKTGMYRIVTIALLILTALSVLLGFLGLLPYSGVEQLISLSAVVLVSFVTNILFARFWRVSANHESALITALILFFLIIPARLVDFTDQWIIASVAVLAIASKFLIVRNKQHIVNPAAFGVLIFWSICAFFPGIDNFEAIWWAGTPVLFIPLLILGGLVVMKVRRWSLVLSFLSVGFVVFLLEAWGFGLDLSKEASRYFLSGPSLFLAFFMLTEPFTTPPTKKLQMTYGAFVGFISQTTIFMPYFVASSEIALIIGNLIFYPTTLRRKLILPLESFRKIADSTYEFIFQKPQGLSFKAGQYLEWMLHHDESDSRGVRRYFTIASSPTEPTLRVAMKIPKEKGSTYKKKMLSMKVGDTIIASQLAGDFLLPKDVEKKLGFIAGGIGITPFRSHLKYMVDSGNIHDTVLFCSNNTHDEISYSDFFEVVKTQMPLQIVQVISKEELGGEYETGFITEEILRRRVPDFAERYWYLSGPPGMVNAYSKLLSKLNVPTSHIIKDYFPGLA